MAQISYSSLPFYRRKKVLLVLILVLLVIAGITTYALTKDDSPMANDTTASTSKQKSDSSYVNLDPPSEEERNATRDERTTASSSGNASKKSVTPVITSADKNEARAFIPGIIEDGGTCTATYTHEADKITATSKGVADVSHTTCPPMTLPGPINIQGEWTVVVSYNSSTASGKSEPIKFKVEWYVALSYKSTGFRFYTTTSLCQPSDPYYPK